MPVSDASALSENSHEEGSPFSITVRIDTTVQPYVALFAVLLFWYLKKVTITVTNTSTAPHLAVSIRLSGSTGSADCPGIEETYVIPRLGPHDTDTRTFSYKRKQDCSYLLSGEIVSYD